MAENPRFIAVTQQSPLAGMLSDFTQATCTE
jgi:hypothetical protein